MPFDDAIRLAATYSLAALCEIGGCYGVWLWRRHHGGGVLALASAVLLGGFAWILANIQNESAGRVYAIYGGIYVAASLVWIWSVEDIRPDKWDLLGGGICLLGAAIIVFGPRSNF